MNASRSRPTTPSILKHPFCLLPGVQGLSVTPLLQARRRESRKQPFHTTR